MRAAVIVNEFETLVPSQATAMLIYALAEVVDEAYVLGVADLGVAGDGGLTASARRVPGPGGRDPAQAGPIAMDAVAVCIAELGQVAPCALPLADCDAILIRTNPARDGRSWAHDGALELLDQLHHRGVQVVNRPDGLRAAGSKLFLAALPAWTRPATLISADRAALEGFVRDAGGPTVVKPVRGTRGADVFKLTPDAVNVRVTLDVLLRQGFVMAQGFVPAAVDGDTRVIVLDGEILTIDGVAAAIRRVPSAKDFRSNLHTGGHAEPATLSDGMRAAVAAIGPLLCARGIRLAGLDFLGDLVCEVNVFATGGFRDAERFGQRPFIRHTVATLLAPAPPARG